MPSGPRRPTRADLFVPVPGRPTVETLSRSGDAPAAKQVDAGDGRAGSTGRRCDGLAARLEAGALRGLFFGPTGDRRPGLGLGGGARAGPRPERLDAVRAPRDGRGRATRRGRRRRLTWQRATCGRRLPLGRPPPLGRATPRRILRRREADAAAGRRRTVAAASRTTATAVSERSRPSSSGRGRRRIAGPRRRSRSRRRPPGIDAAGTVIRSDGVVCRSGRGACRDLPTDRELLRAILRTGSGTVEREARDGRPPASRAGAWSTRPTGSSEVGDVWIEAAGSSRRPTTRRDGPTRTIDARGYVVMPAGWTSIATSPGSKVNAARALRPEEHAGRAVRRRARAAVGDARERAEHVRDRAISTPGSATRRPSTRPSPRSGPGTPTTSSRDTPIIDKAFLVLMGNNHYVMDRIREGERERLRDAVAWLLGATRGYGVKVVNPGGVERWKQGRGTSSTLDDAVDHFDVTPRQILTDAGPGGRRAGPAPPDPPPRPEPRACPATRRPRWRRCRPSTATGPTWPTSSSTATAATPGDPGRFDSQVGRRWPITSTPTRTSPSTSARSSSARRRA